VRFDADANSPHCEQLLSAIDDAHRAAVLRVFAAALDLDMVLKRRGRAVRTLIFSGGGENGKDALRAAIKWIFGMGLTSCSLSTFQAYDDNRKFDAAELIHSRINWPSENDGSINIDKLNSLKLLASSDEDSMKSERKGADAISFTPKCICIFNTNSDAVNLSAAKAATASRYSIVPFNKTFKANPIGPNEIQADPRFKYDKEWVCTEVLPTLLNRLIAEFKLIFSEGIDYSCFDSTMASNRRSAFHLMEFCEEVGLVAGSATSFIPVEHLWTKLKVWYEGIGYLIPDGDGRYRFDSEDPRPGDKLVRSKTTLKQRLQRLFPHITSGKISAGECRGARGIYGLKFASSEPPPVAPTDAPVATAPPAPTAPPDPAPPPLPAVPTDEWGLYATPGIDFELMAVEHELMDARSDDDLARIKATYNGSLSKVMATWRQDTRYDLLLGKVEAIKQQAAAGVTNGG